MPSCTYNETGGNGLNIIKIVIHFRLIVDTVWHWLVIKEISRHIWNPFGIFAAERLWLQHPNVQSASIKTILPWKKNFRRMQQQQNEIEPNFWTLFMNICVTHSDNFSCSYPYSKPV